VGVGWGDFVNTSFAVALYLHVLKGGGGGGGSDFINTSFAKGSPIFQHKSMRKLTSKKIASEEARVPESILGTA
jgi:hypothetical protein